MVVDDFNRHERTIYDCLKSVYKTSKYLKDGNLVSFNESNPEKSKAKLKNINHIRSCLLNDCQNFSLAYQPVLDPKGEKVLGVEALLRFQDVELGLVPTRDYIFTLEQDFAFEELGLWILRHTMQDLGPLLKMAPQLLVGVNVAATQLRDIDFPKTVVEVARQTNFPLPNFCLELKRSCRRIPFDLLEKRLQSLKKQKLKIAIDDFGSGFASLECLQFLPSDLVKIDQRYLRDLETSTTAQKDLEALCLMANAHKTWVCVKGVETEATRQILSKLPLDCLQGFALAPPMDLPTLRDFLPGRIWVF